jgi:hypothetical protein
VMRALRSKDAITNSDPGVPSPPPISIAD